CQYPDPALNSRYFAYSYAGKKPTVFDPAAYINRAADNLIDLADRLSNPAKRFANYAKVLRIYARDLPVIGLATVGPSLSLSGKFSYPTFNGYTSTDGPFVMNIKAK